MAVKGSNQFDSDQDSGESSNQGSIRKVLHTLVGTESLLGKSAKLLDRPKSNNTSLESYSNYFKEYALIAEYNFVVERRIPGVYVVLSEKSELLWFGVIFLRSGYYKGGVFRFVLHIPETFPDCSQPSVFFETDIFHPSINDETLELNLKSIFSNWQKGVNHIWQVLDYMRSIFHNIPAKANSNKKAAELFASDLEDFTRHVKACVERSQRDIYKTRQTDDAHYLHFEEFNEEKHGESLQKLKSGKGISKKSSNKPGLSWMKRGSLKPFAARPFF